MAVIGSSEVEIRGDTSRFQEDAEGGVRSALGGIEGIASNAGNIAGVAGAVGLGAAFAASLDIADANSKLQAQLGLSAEESARYGTIAGDLFTGNYGESMENVNEAIGAVTSSIEGVAGASDEAISTASKNALNLASVFDIDVTEAAGAAGIAIKNGLAKDATGAFDLITASLQKVPAAMRGDFIEVANEYGGVLTGVGLTGSQAMGYLTIAAQGGSIALDKAGDSVKEFTLKATDGSAGTVAAYQSLGLNATQMASDIVAGGDKSGTALASISSKLLEIKDPALQAQTAVALFGTPLEDLGIQKVPEFLKAMSGTSDALGEVGGKAAELDTTVGQTASGAITSFTRTVQTEVTNAVGGVLIPKILEANRVMQEHGLAADAIKVIVVGALVAMGVAATVNLTRMAIGFVTTAVTSTISAVTTVASYVSISAAAIASGATTAAIAGLYVLDWLRVQGAAVAGAAGVVAGWVSTGIAATAAFVTSIPAYLGIAAGWIASAASATAGAIAIAAAWLISIAPIALVIAAVVGIVIVIVKNWDTIKEKTGQAWDWVSEKVSSAWNAVSGAVSGGISKVVTFVKELPGKIWDTFVGMNTMLVTAGADLIGGFIQGIKNKATDLINMIKETITDKLPGFVKDALGINSPSLVMMALGEHTMDGYTKGLDKRAGAAQEAMASAIGGDFGTNISYPNFGSGGGGIQINVDINAPGADQGTVTAIRSAVRNELASALGDVMNKTRAGAAA